VVYPIDAIKVRKFIRSDDVRSNIDSFADTNADPEPDTLRRLQWYDPRRLSDSHKGRILEFMAGDVKCCGRSRLVDLNSLRRSGF